MLFRSLILMSLAIFVGCAPQPLAPGKGASYDVVAEEYRAAGDQLTVTSKRVAELEVKLSSAPEADRAAIQTELEAAKTAASKAEGRAEVARQKLLEAEKDMPGGDPPT